MGKKEESGSVNAGISGGGKDGGDVAASLSALLLSKDEDDGDSDDKGKDKEKKEGKREKATTSGGEMQGKGAVKTKNSRGDMQGKEASFPGEENAVGKKERDPLQWFGVLVPRDLRAAQQRFKDGNRTKERREKER